MAEQTLENRDGFSSKLGFILACIGSAVGMGNIWLFPYRMATFGGAFLLVYLIIDALLGFSGVIGEITLGRGAKAGPVGAFGNACGIHGKRKLGEVLGFIPMLGALSLAIGYAVVIGWICKYTFKSFNGSLLALEGADAFGAEFGATASAFGNNGWVIFGLVITFIVMCAGIAGGIEKMNKVMIPLFFVMFIFLAIYVACQPGAAAGYAWMFTVDPEQLKNPMLYVYALGQSFFSLSIAGNGTVIYGSYLDKNNDIVSTAWKIALFDTLAALLAALTIIPAMATTGAILSESGPGLMFISLPYLFQGMPGGNIVMMVFFVAVLFAGLTSLVNLFEAPIATLQDNLHMSRIKAVVLIGTIGSVSAVCIQGIVSGWMDVVSIYVCPLGAAMAGIMLTWVWGRKNVEDELSIGRTKRIGGWFYPLHKYVFCTLTVVVLIAGAVFGGIG